MFEVIFEKGDECVGVLEEKVPGGVKIRLENNEFAFAFNFQSWPVGQEVLCTVLRPQSEGRLKLVSIDSVKRIA